MVEPTIDELLERRSFSIERTGYSSTEVHRLFRELRDAHEAGRPLAPLIDAANLQEVSFGYDMAAVTETLLAIADTDDRGSGAGEPAGPPSEPLPTPTAVAESSIVSQAPVTPSSREAASTPARSPRQPAARAPGVANHPSMPGEDPAGTPPVPYAVTPPSKPGDDTVRKAFVIIFIVILAVMLLGVFA